MSSDASSKSLPEDERFAHFWRNMPPWDDAIEIDVREEFLTPLLQHLGYGRGTIMDIKREEEFKLSTPFLVIGRDKIKIDYVPKVRLKRFFIVETKSPQDQMDQETLLQAMFYAMHPEVNARFVCLCNGKRLEVFRVGSDPYDEPLLTMDQASVTPAQIRGLRETLGARAIAKTLRNQTIDILRETLDVEIDEQAAQDLEASLRAMMQQGRIKVKQNADEIRQSAWKTINEHLERQRREAPFATLLIMLDVPTNAHPRYGRELGQRLVDASPGLRREMLDTLAMTWRSRMHSVFLVHCTHAMLNLLMAQISIEGTAYISSVEKEIDELAQAAASYHEGSDLSRALRHLDNTAIRVGYKLSRKIGTDVSAKLLEQQRQTMSAEDRIADIRSAASTVLSLTNVVSEFWLWRRFASNASPDKVYQGIWDLESLEGKIDGLPDAPYPEGDGDMMSFDAYGRGVDMLTLGTWHMLSSHRDLVNSAGLSDGTRAFANLKREDALAGIPPSPQRPPSWDIQDEQIRKISDSVIGWTRPT